MKREIRIGTILYPHSRFYEIMVVDFKDGKPVRHGPFMGVSKCLNINEIGLVLEELKTALEKPILNTRNLQPLKPECQEGGYVRVDEMPDDMKKDFMVWIRSQTLPVVPGETSICAYYHDFERFYAAWIRGETATPID